MKPTLVMDQHFRTVEELFSPRDYERLASLCDIVGGVNWPMPREQFEAHIETMAFLVAAHPRMDRSAINRAANLKAIIEVAGSFNDGLDYDACFERGIDVLSCAPGFCRSVAEMTVGLMIAGARGIVQEHEAFRNGHEHWLADNPHSDFSLYGQTIGFVGFGSIARECVRLLAPFAPRVLAFDPWLEPSDVNKHGATLCSLDEVVSESRSLVIAAMPTDQNWRLVGRLEIEKMPRGALLVLASRSHLVDFPALLQAAREQRIRAAIDVFPQEPVFHDDDVRSIPNVILSPHRAAAVVGGRHLIGEMIADDIEAILSGGAASRLKPADPATLDHILGARAVAQRKTA